MYSSSVTGVLESQSDYQQKILEIIARGQEVVQLITSSKTTMHHFNTRFLYGLNKQDMMC